MDPSIIIDLASKYLIPAIGAIIIFLIGRAVAVASLIGSENV